MLLGVLAPLSTLMHLEAHHSGSGNFGAAGSNQLVGNQACTVRVPGPYGQIGKVKRTIWQKVNLPTIPWYCLFFFFFLLVLRIFLLKGIVFQ